MKLEMISINFTINGEKKQLDIPAGMTALELIRERLELKGTKEGCGIGECGACTIIVDERAVNACLMFAAQLDGREILTVEGLERNGGLDPVQEAFAEKHAVDEHTCPADGAIESGSERNCQSDFRQPLSMYRLSQYHYGHRRCR
jgi:carbon-monoxide dehydrogenase small subunit